MGFGLSPIDLGLKYGRFGKTEKSPEERKRLRRRRWRRIAGILAVLVVAFVIFRVYGRFALNREIAKLRAKAYPMTFAELESYNQLPKGVPNAAEIYMKAFESYQPATEEEKKIVPNLGSVVRKPEEFKTDEMKEVLRSFLTRNDGTLELLHKAGRVEQCRYEYPMKPDQGFLFPYYENMRDCGLLLRQYALIQIDDGHIREACRSIQDAIRLGESLKMDPILISYCVRLALDVMAVDVLQTVFSKEILHLDQYDEFASQIRMVQQNLQINPTLIGERIFQISDRNPLGKLDFTYVMARHVGLGDYNALCFFDYLDQYEKANALRPARRLDEYKRIMEEVDHLSVFCTLTKDVLRKLDGVFKIDLRVGSQLDNAVAAIAVERYRLDKGRFPESLRDLVPKYLESTPLDPFDGKPLRYKRLEKGYTIYSIGEDVEDNGGVPKDKVEKGAHYDWPFTVERE